MHSLVFATIAVFFLLSFRRWLSEVGEFLLINSTGKLPCGPSLQTQQTNASPSPKKFLNRHVDIAYAE